MEVERTAIYVRLDVELLKWVDNKIDEKEFSTRSHAVEYALHNLREIIEGRRIIDPKFFKK